ncbi:SPTB2 protein, partial [Glaucidium brasilianum]|nr:SPTB2 protein [Glaucidium brasilianum]
GYQPCDPSTVREQVATLELRYRELSELSATRRARLEESRRFWKFFWDAGEEEAWMREQERLLSSEDVGRDLTSSLRLLNRHDAFRGELSARAGPLQQALAQGRLLVAEGHLETAQVAQRVREVEERWRALGELAGERERRLREAAGFFQFQAEAADAAAWLDDVWRLVSSRDLGHDEYSTRSLSRQHRDVEEEIQNHRPTVEALREQAGVLSPAYAATAAAELPALERRYREVTERAERRRRELRDALDLYTVSSEAAACALWVGEKERWLLNLRLPDRLEDLEVVQQRFETLEPEMNNLASRVAAVNRLAEQLLAEGRGGREGTRGACEQLNARWQRVRALAQQRREALAAALDLGNFQLGCAEAAAWMRQKSESLASPREPGSDPPGLPALQRGLAAMQRDLEAIEAKVRDLRAEGEKLVAREEDNEERAGAVRARLAAVEEVWAELRAGLRRHEEALGEAAKLQGFLRDLAALQGWLARTRATVAAEDIPATLGEAESLLSQHESVGKEIARYGDDYGNVTAAGREVTRGQTEPQRLLLGQRLEALVANWEELGRMWETRRQALAQAVAFQAFLRDSKQVQGVLSAQEYALSHTELATTLPAAEAAVKKHEDFLATMEANVERVQALVATGHKLVAEGSPHAEKV